jgi:hypothetical protein
MVVFPRSGFATKKLFILRLSFGLCVPTVAFARGLGMHHSNSGGAFGRRAAAPGTNSLDTALEAARAASRDYDCCVNSRRHVSTNTSTPVTMSASAVFSVQ